MKTTALAVLFLGILVGSLAAHGATRSVEQRQQYVANYKIFCEKDCHPSSAAVFIIEVGLSQISNCTASLIGPDTLLTNNHCLPEDIAMAGSSCKDRMYFKFPRTSQYDETTVGCESIIRTSSELKKDHPSMQGQPVGPDFALIKLSQPVNRPTLKVEATPILHNQKVFISRVNFNRQKSEGILTTVSCVVSKISFLAHHALTPLSPVIILKNCPIIPGNSGSAILNDRNQIVGIITSHYPQAALDDFSKNYGVQNANHAGLGVSSGCILQKETCVYDSVNNMKQRNDFLTQQLSPYFAQIQTEASSFILQNKERIFEIEKEMIPFKGSLINDTAFIRLRLLPQCIKGNPNSFETKSPWWVLKIMINGDFEPSFALKRAVVQTKFKKLFGDNFYIESANPADDSILRVNKEIHACNPSMHSSLATFLDATIQ